MTELNLEVFTSEMDKSISNFMTQSRIPGLAIAVVNDREIVYSKGFGSRNMEEFLPFTADTLNGFGSCTKSFTALAIMQLVSQEKMSVEDPVSKFLDFRIDTNEKPILVKHLLSHSSGIPNLGTAELVIGQTVPDLDFPAIPFSSWSDFYLHINGGQEEIKFEPGEHFHYFNGGYTILGQIIEKVSGQDYLSYIRENILNPLEMDRSGFLRDELDGNLSLPYVSTHRESQPKPKATSFPFNHFIYAPGGLVSSVNEMAKYLSAMMNKGKYNGGELIDEINFEKMITPGIVRENIFDSFGDSSYGYGWGILQDFMGNTLIQHGGGITGGYSMMGFLKEKKIGIVMITNFAPLPIHVYLNGFAYLLGKDPGDEFEFLKRTNHLNSLVGDYESYKQINKRKIVNKSGVLFLEAKTPIESSLPLIPLKDELKPLKFYLSTPLGKMEAEFIVKEGEAIRLIIERNSYHKIK